MTSNIAYEIKHEQDLCSRDFYLVLGEDLLAEIEQASKDEKALALKRKAFIKKNKARNLMHNGDDIVALVLLEGREPVQPGMKLANPKARMWQRHSPWMTYRGRKYMYWVPGTTSRKKEDKNIAEETHKLFRSMNTVNGGDRVMAVAEGSLSRICICDERQIMTNPQLLKAGDNYIITVSRGDKDKVGEERQVEGMTLLKPSEAFALFAEHETGK